MTLTLERLTADNRPYQPFGAAKELMTFKGSELLLAGPAGTGKTRSLLEKLHLCAEKYAGMRALIIRKERTSLTETALVTWEEKVVPPSHPILEGAQRSHRQAYHYPNGSEVVIGGLDKPIKVMSSEYDLVIAPEATELDENEWESLTTRLRNHVMPYQQLLADCNPGPPTHWLKRRADKGLTVMLHSRHEDNPAMYERKTGQFTENGKAYLAKLERLTGVLYRRLRKGEWAGAEGLVYEQFDSAVHVISASELPVFVKRYRGVDFGYSNPFSCLWIGEDYDGRLYVYREIYRTKRLVEDHAPQIAELSEGERYEALVCDHDAEDRATLERHLGERTLPAHKTVSTGIEAVQSRLKVQPDGKPRLFLVRGLLVERDAELEEAGKPCGILDELDVYAWAKTQDGSNKDAPVKDADHSLDNLRYIVAYVDGLGKQGDDLTATDMMAAMAAAARSRKR
jgi:PBSX family phage terminase large subunit